VYAWTWIDLSKGPVVIESTPDTLGLVDDFWFRYVADVGNAGPDKGKGGKYVFLPPGYTGDVPKGYFVYKSRTFGNIFFTRGFLVDGNPGPAVESFHKLCGFTRCPRLLSRRGHAFGFGVIGQRPLARATYQLGR
jgi:hypothetical protein